MTTPDVLARLREEHAAVSAVFARHWCDCERANAVGALIDAARDAITEIERLRALNSERDKIIDKLLAKVSSLRAAPAGVRDAREIAVQWLSDYACKLGAPADALVTLIRTAQRSAFAAGAAAMREAAAKVCEGIRPAIDPFGAHATMGERCASAIRALAAPAASAKGESDGE